MIMPNKTNNKLQLHIDASMMSMSTGHEHDQCNKNALAELLRRWHAKCALRTRWKIATKGKCNNTLSILRVCVLQMWMATDACCDFAFNASWRAHKGDNASANNLHACAQDGRHTGTDQIWMSEKDKG